MTKNLKLWLLVALALSASLAFVFARAGRVVVLRPWPLEAGEAERLGLSEPVAASLALASLAPSSHNTQPWKVRVMSEREVLVLLDEKRLLPAVDPERREALVSIGAFLENLVRGAESQGLAAKVEITADGPSGTGSARVSFEPAAAGGEKKILEAILARNTFRGPLPADPSPPRPFGASRGPLLPDGHISRPQAPEGPGSERRLQSPTGSRLQGTTPWRNCPAGSVFLREPSHATGTG